jgi:hypothetical protein
MLVVYFGQRLQNMSKKWPVIWHRILQLKIDFLAARQTQRVCHFSTSLCEVTDITTSKHNRELAANGHEESPDHWDILPLFEEDGEKKKKTDSRRVDMRGNVVFSNQSGHDTNRFHW